MNALLDDLDLENTDADQFERDIKLAGAIPAAKYHARLVEAQDREAGAFSVVSLKFEVLTPPYAGKIVPMDLFIAGPFETPEKETKAKTQRKIFLHRLGMLRKASVNGKNVYTPVPGKAHFRDVLGQQCIVDVVLDERKGEGRYAGRTFTENKLNWGGVYMLDDPAVKDVPRANGVHAPLPSASKPVNLDDI